MTEQGMAPAARTDAELINAERRIGELTERLQQIEAELVETRAKRRRLADALGVIAVGVAKAVSVTAAIGAKGFYVTPDGAERIVAALRATGLWDEPQVSAAEPPSEALELPETPAPSDSKG